jgi:uncharacterized protein YsxB (DUF464 family)
MIRITIERNSNGQICGFEAKGHANAGPRGQDIVCAAVSVLTDSIFLGLDKHLRRELEWSAEAGDIAVRLKDEPDELTETLLATMFLGLSEIQNIYPEKIRIREIRR